MFDDAILTSNKNKKISKNTPVKTNAGMFDDAILTSSPKPTQNIAPVVETTAPVVPEKKSIVDKIRSAIDSTPRFKPEGILGQDVATLGGIKTPEQPYLKPSDIEFQSNTLTQRSNIIKQKEQELKNTKVNVNDKKSIEDYNKKIVDFNNSINRYNRDIKLFEENTGKIMDKAPSNVFSNIGESYSKAFNQSKGENIAQKSLNLVKDFGKQTLPALSEFGDSLAYGLRYGVPESIAQTVLKTSKFVLENEKLVSDIVEEKTGIEIPFPTTRILKAFGKQDQALDYINTTLKGYEEINRQHTLGLEDAELFDPTKFGRNVGFGGSSMLISLGTGAVTKSTTLAGAVLGVMQGSDTYIDAQQVLTNRKEEELGRPLTEEEQLAVNLKAGAYGIADGTVSAYLEKIGLDAMFSQNTASIKALSETFQEVIQQFGTNVIKSGYDPEVGLFDDLAETAFVMLPIGYLSGGAVNTIDIYLKRRQREELDKKLKDIGIKDEYIPEIREQIIKKTEEARDALREGAKKGEVIAQVESEQQSVPVSENTGTLDTAIEEALLEAQNATTEAEIVVDEVSIEKLVNDTLEGKIDDITNKYEELINAKRDEGFSDFEIAREIQKQFNIPIDEAVKEVQNTVKMIEKTTPKVTKTIDSSLSESEKQLKEKPAQKEQKIKTIVENKPIIEEKQPKMEEVSDISEKERLNKEAKDIADNATSEKDFINTLKENKAWNAENADQIKDGKVKRKVEIGDLFEQNKEKFQTKQKAKSKKGFISSEQALEEALKIPLLKELNSRGQVVLAEKLNNPQALGSYLNGVIKYIKDPHNTTLPHEAFHAFLDMILTESEKSQALSIVKKYGMSDLQAEEVLAQSFAEWYVAQQNKSILDKIFTKIANFFKELVGVQDEMTSLFNRVLDKKLLERINKFESLGGITKLREEYNQSPVQFTTELFEDQQIWKKETQKRATIISALGRLRKPLMKQFVANKLDTDFKGQEVINMEEFRRSLTADLLDMKIIETKKYADYGLGSIDRIFTSDKNYGTYIINTNFLHGRTGHFSGEFDSKTTKDDLEIRTVTAGVHDVDGQAQRVDKDQYWVTRKDLNINNLQEGTFGKFDTEQEAQEYINNFSDRRVEEAGLFGHFRAFDDGDFNIVELQSDIFQHSLNAFARSNKRMMENDLSIIQENIDGLEKTIRGFKIQKENQEKEIENLKKQIALTKKNNPQQIYSIKVNEDIIKSNETSIKMLEESITNKEEYLTRQEEEKQKVIAKYSGEEGLYFKSEFIKNSKGLETLAEEFKDKISLYKDEIKQKNYINSNDFEVPSENRFRLNWYSTYKTGKTINAPNFYNLADEYGKDKLSNLITLYGDYYNSTKGTLDKSNALWGWNSKTVEERKKAVKEFNEEYLPMLEKTVKELEDFSNFVKEKAEKPLSSKEQKEIAVSEQFISFKNNYYEVIINSAIRQGALSGAEYINFPTPYTVANVEGYVDTNSDFGEQGSYTDEEISNMSIGDRLDILDYNGVLVGVDSDSYEVAYSNGRDEARVYYEDDIKEQEYNNLSEEFENTVDVDNLKAEMIAYAQDSFDGTEEEIDEIISAIESNSDNVEELIANKNIPKKVIEGAKESILDTFKDDFDAESFLVDIYGENNVRSFGEDQFVVATDGELFVETLSYKTKYEGGAEEFTSENIPNEEHRTIAFKYGVDENGKEGEIYKYLKKKRKDLVEFTDENGYTWYKTQVTPEDKAGVEMFQTRDQVLEERKDEISAEAITILQNSKDKGFNLLLQDRIDEFNLIEKEQELLKEAKGKTLEEFARGKDMNEYQIINIWEEANKKQLPVETVRNFVSIFNSIMSCPFIYNIFF